VNAVSADNAENVDSSEEAVLVFRLAAQALAKSEN
jgi:hypothetical protein